MTGAELARRRVAAGLTLDQLAEVLGEPAAEVERWESIDGSLPGSLQRRIEWELAVLERDRAIDAAGLPDCATATAIVDGADPARSKDLERRMRELEAHAPGCEICTARDAFVRTLPPLPPVPHSAAVRALAWMIERGRRLPPWLRPAALGGVLMLALTLFRAIVRIGVGGAPLTARTGLMVLGAAAVGVYLGLLGGLAHHFAGRRVMGVRAVGPYLAGVLVLGAMALGVGVPSWVIGGAPLAEVKADLLVGGVVVPLLGAVLGHALYRPTARDDAQ